MTPPLTADVLQDDLALSVAHALAVANRRARESGIDVLERLITITQRSVDDGLSWQINYGPKDYIGRRGGDFMVEVDPTDASIKEVLWGQ